MTSEPPYFGTSAHVRSYYRKHDDFRRYSEADKERVRLTPIEYLDAWKRSRISVLEAKASV